MNIDFEHWPRLFQAFGRNLDAWLSAVDPLSLLLALLFLVGVFLVRKSLGRWIVNGCRSLLHRFEIEISDDVAAQLRVGVEVLVVTFSIYLVIEVFDPPEFAGGIMRRVMQSVAVVAVFATWFQLSGPFVSMLRKEIKSQEGVETDWVLSVTRFAILLFGITALLEVWQVDISGALTGVGVLGAGLAIATQDLIRNLVAGMTNMSEKRFKTGDAIQIDSKFIGSVKRIDLRSTLVVGFDQIPRYIPNSDLSNSMVLNYSELEHRRVMLKVPLVMSATRDQIEAVRDGLVAYHNSSGDFDLSDVAPQYINVSELGPSSVDIFFYARTAGPDYGTYLQVVEGLTLTILELVRRAGTALAYPTQVVHLEHDPGLAAARPGPAASSD